jgi:hypothetical protein
MTQRITDKYITQTHERTNLTFNDPLNCSLLKRLFNYINICFRDT